MEKNLIQDGKWLILMEDATIVDKTIYTEFKGYTCNAVIATAS